MLGDSILWEYVYFIGVSVFLWFLLPEIVSFLADLKKGWEGLGVAMIMIAVDIALHIILPVYFFIMKPIRIWMTYGQEIASITPGFKRFGVHLLIGLPIPFSILFFFRRKVEESLERWWFGTGKNGYSVHAYKSPGDFQRELTERNLFFTEEHRELLDSLNKKYEGCMGYYKEVYYTPARMTAFNEQHEDGYGRDVLVPGYELWSPAYIYNSILTLRQKGGSLSYAPIGRYTMCESNARGDGNDPYHKDYYIECKILYIDGHVYAIIGVGESRCIQECFLKHHRPFYVLLSEEQKITTYYEGKYYPDGAIDNGFAHVYPMSMHPNRRGDWRSNPRRPILYPVRKVERVDEATINAVARELQDGILKKSVKRYFSDRYAGSES